MVLIGNLVIGEGWRLGWRGERFNMPLTFC